MSIGKDAGYSLAAAVAPALFMLALLPMYLHVIGAERFGVLAICWTIIAATRFASLGMGPALTYRLAKMDDASSDLRSSLVWTALILGLTASLAGTALVFGIGEIYFRYFFRAASVMQGEIRHSLPLLAALLPAAIAVGVLNGALQGLRLFRALGAISIFNAALLAITPLAAAVLVSPRLDTLILAIVAASVAVTTVELAVCVKLIPLSLPKRPKWSDMTALLEYGLWMSGTALIAPLVILLDRLVLGALRGPAAVAVYVLPYNVVQQLVLLPASLTSAMLPRLAPLSDDEAQQLQSSSLLWLNGLLTPLAVVGIALAAPFFDFWIGRTLAKAASPVAAILLVGGWMHGIGHIPSTFVVGRSRPDLLTKLLLAYLVPYAVVLYFATLYFGVIGAAAAWTGRAAFDPILFAYTRPYASDVRHVAGSAALVVAAMMAALLLSWTSPLYWLLMLLMLAATAYQNRDILLSLTGSVRRVPLLFPLPPMGGEVGGDSSI